MLEDSEGNIWFGGNAEGVSRYDGIAWHNYSQDNGLARNWYFTIKEDSQHRIWFGGDCYFAGGKIHNLSELDGPPHGVVEFIFEDSRGVIWFTTWDDGLYALEGDNWTRYTTGDGLVDNTFKSIFEDSRGRIWFGTWGSGISGVMMAMSGLPSLQMTGCLTITCCR